MRDPFGIIDEESHNEAMEPEDSWIQPVNKAKAHYNILYCKLNAKYDQTFRTKLG